MTPRRRLPTAFGEVSTKGGKKCYIAIERAAFFIKDAFVDAVRKVATAKVAKIKPKAPKKP